MSSEVKPIHQLGGSTLVTMGSFPGLPGAEFCVGAAVTEGKRTSEQHKAKSGRETKRPVIEGQNFFTPEG
jgi:hypothetical protein